MQKKIDAMTRKINAMEFRENLETETKLRQARSNNFLGLRKPA